MVNKFEQSLWWFLWNDDRIATLFTYFICLFFKFIYSQFLREKDVENWKKI